MARQERPDRTIEHKLDQAKTPAWAECPAWVRQKISPLARFITHPVLQRAIVQQGVEQRVMRDKMTDALTPEYLADLQHQAHEAVEQRADHEVDIVPRDKPYHNHQHDHQVVDRVGRIMQLSRPPLSKQRAEVVLLAAAYHDAEHPGGPAALRPEDGRSYEQHAVEVADAAAVERGFNLRQRIELACTILGSTFGDAVVEPCTQTERLLRLADVGGYIDTPAAWMEQSVNVAEEYAAADPASVRDWLSPTDFDQALGQWLQWQMKFVDYLETVHADYRKRYTDPDQPWELDALFAEKKTIIQQLLANVDDSRYVEIMQSVRERLEKIRARSGQSFHR